MDSGKVNQWLALAANFGVIVSLLLLTFEINQSTKATVAAASNSVVDGYNTLNLSVMSDPQLTRVFIVDWLISNVSDRLPATINRSNDGSITVTVNESGRFVEKNHQPDKGDLVGPIAIGEIVYTPITP